jgi:hypothetical protein
MPGTHLPAGRQCGEVASRLAWEDGHHARAPGPSRLVCSLTTRVMFYAWCLILPRQPLAIFITINHYCWLPGDGSLISVRNASHEDEDQRQRTRLQAYSLLEAGLACIRPSLPSAQLVTRCCLGPGFPPLVSLIRVPASLGRSQAGPVTPTSTSVPLFLTSEPHEGWPREASGLHWRSREGARQVLIRLLL